MDVMKLVATLSLDSQDFDKGLKGAESKATGFGSRFTSAFKGISDTFTTAGRQISLFGNNITQIGSTLTSGITQPALGAAEALGKMFLGAGWERMTNLDTARAKLRGLGMDAEQVSGVMDSAMAAVNETAYSLDAAATTAASAVAAGIQQGDELTRYLTNVADAASIAGIGMDEMGSIFNKVATNGKATSEVLNQLADRGVPIFTWLGEAAGKTGDEIRDMVRKGQVDLELFQQAIETHIGGAARELGDATITGAIANVQSAIAKIGEAFLGASDDANTFAGQVLPLIVEFKNFLNQQIKPAAKDLGLIFGQVFNAIVQYVRTGTVSLEGFSDKAVAVFSKIQPVIDGIRRAFEILSGVSPKVLAVFAGIAVALGPVLTFIGQFINAIGILTTLFGALLTPAGIIVTVLGAMALAFASTQADAAGLTGVLSDIANAFKDLGEKALDFATNGMNRAAEAIRDFDWAEAVRTSINNIKEFFSGDSLQDFFEAGFNLLKSIAQGFSEALPEIAKELPGLIGEIAAWFVTHVDDFLEIGLAIVSGIAGALGNAVLELPNMLVDFGKGVQDAIYDKLGLDAEAEREKTQELKESFRRVTEGALAESQDELSVAARGAGNTIGDEFGGGLQETLPPKVGEAATEASNAFTAGIGSIISGTDQTFAEVNLATSKGLDMLERQLDERTKSGVETADANLRQLAEMAGISYDELTGTTEEKMAVVTEAIGSGILNGNMEAETALRELNNILNVNWDEIKSAAEYAFGEEGITSSVLTAWTNIQTQTTTVWGEILASLQEIWNSITVGAQEAFSGVGIQTAFAQMKSAVDTGMASIKTAFTTGWTVIKSSTATSWAAIVQAVTTGTNNMKIACQTGFTAIRTVITTAWKAIQTSTQSTWNQIRSLLTTTWINLKTHADTSFKQTAVVIRTAWMQVQTETISTWSVIQAFLIECVGQIKSAFLDEDWVGVGTSIIDGIREGILSKAGELAEAAAEVCRTALSAAKAAIESASPSKLFRREVGQMITLGIALGIKDKGAEVNKNIEEVLKSAHDTAVKVRNQIADSLRNLESTLADEELKYQEEVNKRKAEEYERQLAELYEELGEAEEEEREKVQEKITKMEQDHQNELLNQEREYTRNKLQLHIDSLKEIQSAYETELKAIEDREASFVDKMREYGDLFKKIKDKETEEEYLQLENIRDQITVLEDYGNMLQQMKEKAIPDTLLSEILSMDIDDASMYMQELQNMTDEDFADYLAAWEEKQALTADIAKKFYEDQVNAVNESFTQKMMEGLSNMQAEMMGIGINAVEGMHDGLNQGLPGLIEAARNIAQSVIFAMKSEMGIASPSRVMREQVGKMISEGVAEGMIDGIPEVEGAAEEVENSINLDPSQMLMQMMKMFTDAWGSSGFIPVWQNGFARLTAVISEWGIAALELFRQIINEIMQSFETADWHSVGLAITDGITRGINAGQSSVINAAVSAATAALRAAKSALGISSPSSVFRDEVGLQISKGIALGITDGIKEVETAMQQATATIAETPFEITDSDAQSGLLSRGFTQINNIQSPIALDPSEVARQTRWQTQEMVLALNRG